MKKIAIATNKMVMGGIEKSLIELIRVLLSFENEITLFLQEEEGDLFDSIPKEVTIKKMDYKTSIIDRLRKKRLSEKFNILLSYIKLHKSKNYAEECDNIVKIYDTNLEQYDIAIAYSSPISVSNYYVINNIKAKKKILFIHNDISQITISPYLSDDLYNKFDKIVAVSQYSKNKFLDYFPCLFNKTDYLYNFIDVNSIHKLAKEGRKCKSIHYKICTVGRLSEEKGQDLIPYVINKLNSKEIIVDWFLIGDGPLKEKINLISEQLNVSDQVHITGFLSNPYGYMESCDIYVQTSRQEGYGITISEAKILSKVIVCTDFPCAYEHINNNENGMICKCDVQSITDALSLILENNSFKNYLEKNAKINFFENDISKLRDILEV